MSKHLKVRVMLKISKEAQIQVKLLNAIEQVGIKLEVVLDRLKVNDYIKDFEIQIEPYNSGYMLKTSTKYSYKAIGEEILDKIGYLLNYSIHIQPDSFFGQEIEEDGYSRIRVNYFDDRESNKYDSIRVSNLKEVDLVCLQFVERVNVNKILTKANLL